MPSAPLDPALNAATFFESLVADADEGIVVLDGDGLILYANPAAEFLLSHGREELAGEMFGFPPLLTEQPTRVNVISRDGCVRLAELRVERLAADRGGGRVLLRFKDITGYHQDVVAAREQVRRRDEFLAMLSHELRNPLSAIRGASLLLARDDLQPDARRGAADILDRQFKHLERLLGDLLDVTRISQGKLEIRKERVDVVRVVQDALEEAAPLIERRQHCLQRNIPSHPVWVEGDPTRLGQVVVNLVNNAAKFTPPRGNIRVEVAAEGGQVEVRVSDDGPGIAADLLPRVFEPFVQGRQSLARDEGGLGIGLSLAHSIVQLHGGTISPVANPDGRGITFTVRLLTSAPGADLPSPPQAGQPLPLRVLLVEDSDDARGMTKRILELEGFDVLEARDGPAGLAAILGNRPDVALVDIGLPGMDGYELARRARQDEKGKNVRLIAVTGYGMPQDVREARRAGFDGHLVKPLRFPELFGLLREGKGSLNI
jgi:signal transduction histidine kinase